MRPRHRTVDLNGATFFLSASDRLVEVAQVGLDLADQPVFIGGCRLYSHHGDVICLSGRRPELHSDDLVVDILRDPDAVVPTEVLLAAAHGLAEPYLHGSMLDLPIGDAMQYDDVERAIDLFLNDYPRFQRYRGLLISGGVREFVAGEEEP